jgi:hypothetical protein
VTARPRPACSRLRQHGLAAIDLAEDGFVPAGYGDAITAMNDDAGARRNDRDGVLAVYLHDHFAGSTARLALARRCRRGNARTALDEVLAAMETELGEDRRTLRAMMSPLLVSTRARSSRHRWPRPAVGSRATGE